MKQPKFEFYTRLNGHNEFIEFLQALPKKDKQKLLATIDVIQEKGLLVAQRMEWVKKLDNDIFEIQRYLLISGVLYTSMRLTIVTSSLMDLLRKLKKHRPVKSSMLKN